MPAFAGYVTSDVTIASLTTGIVPYATTLVRQGVINTAGAIALEGGIYKIELTCTGDQAGTFELQDVTLSAGLLVLTTTATSLQTAGSVVVVVPKTGKTVRVVAAGAGSVMGRKTVTVAAPQNVIVINRIA